MNEESFGPYMYGEGVTANGQAVKFTCRPDKVELVREFLGTNIRTIDIPTTGRVDVAHGSYGQYTRYSVKQHRYSGGGPGENGAWGYIEVLEIADPPDGRCGVVIYECNSWQGSAFTEWESVDMANSAFELSLRRRTDEERLLSQQAGFKRHVVCGALTPWFYAIGDEQLIGDYAFPEGLQDDPVFRFGKRFVVYDEDGVPSIKTCMGTRLRVRKREEPPHKESTYRLVYWHDGSVWDESGTNPWWSNNPNSRPRAVEDGELWITEAVAKFAQLLSGKKDEFSIDFIGGMRFFGKLARRRGAVPQVEGNYFLVVHPKGEEKPHTGWVRGFKPTAEHPDIIQFVTQEYGRKGLTVERIEVKKCNPTRGGKKWAGVFWERSG